MIAIRQKLKAVADATTALLKNGVSPDTTSVLKLAAKARGMQPWGAPLAKLRPAYPGGKIGGKDGRDIERTYEEIRQDIQTLYEEMVDTAGASLAGYNKFSARAAVLRSRILTCLQKAGYEYTRVTTGGEICLSDTFTSGDSVDFAATNAELDFTGGFVTLPISPANVQAIQLDNSYVVSVETNQFASDFMEAFDGDSTKVWTANLNGDKYVVRVKLQSTEATKLANAIAVDPITQIGITIEYSNDNYNFYTLVENKKIASYTKFHFDPRTMTDLRFSITATGAAAIRSIQLLKSAYETQAVLQSKILLAKNAFFELMPHTNQYVPISSMQVMVDADIPTGTRIDAYVAPVTLSNGTDGTDVTPVPVVSSFRRVTGDRIWFAASEQQRSSVSTAGFTPELSGSETTHVYKHAFPNTSVPIASSAKLYKGGQLGDAYGQSGQFLVEYYNIGELASGDYVPTAEDWNTSAAKQRGYFSPTIDYPASIDPLVSNSDILLANQTNGSTTMLTEAQNYYQQGKGEYTEGVRSRLVIGIVGNDSARLLTAKGMYRFSTWVWCPEDLSYANQPCFCYNLGGLGTPSIAPYTIYLNGGLVASDKYAHSANYLVEEDLDEKLASFHYKHGWNNLEIYVYIADTTIGVTQADGTKVSSSAVGIYITPSPYYIARTNPEVIVRAHKDPLRRVDEFTLRHSSALMDDTIWALSGEALPSILLNTNPATRVPSALYFDGIHMPEDPAFSVEYRTDAATANRPVGVVFRAVLSRDANSSQVPRLLGYSIVANQDA